MLFDGKLYSKKKEILLKSGILNIKAKGIMPKLVVVVIGEDQSFLNMADRYKRYIEGLGAEVDIYKLPQNTKIEDIKILIDSLNTDELVHQIMINSSETEIADLIAESKKVPDASVKAKQEILKIAEVELKREVANFEDLELLDYEVLDLEDVVSSCSVENLIEVANN